MLGPLLVELASQLRTSVASAGQLAGAIAIAWAVTALLAGPLSDIYGRRRLLLTGLMLMGLGVLASGFAWNYSSLLACRLLTGVGAAMIPPNCFAAVADIFPLERRGSAIGWLVSATGISAALGVAMVAFLLSAGGWRIPFYAIGAISLVVWALLWVWFPQSRRQQGRSLSFISHFREVGSNATIWYLLGANGLLQMAFIGVFSYLAANLIQTYGLTAGETVLPLALAGLGVIVGGFIGGRIAGHHRRLAFLAIASLICGLLAVLVFSVQVSPWLTVVMAFGVGSMATISWAVLPMLLMELASSSRTTATGMFATSNQIGVFGDAWIGGAILALGGFPMVGFFCLGAAMAGSLVVMLKVRDPVKSVEGMAMGESGTS